MVGAADRVIEPLGLGDTEPPTVSFVMSMRNSATTIDVCIESLLWQTFSDWELVLLDDGSSDDSIDRVVAFADRRIRIHAFESSSGLPLRLNQGVDLARGRFIARMDADDVCYPDRLIRQLDHIDRHALDLVGAAAVVFRGDGEAVARFRVPGNHEGIVARPWAGFQLPHPSWLGRSEWFRKHRYDPFNKMAQDQDVLLRSFTGSRLGAVKDPLLGYRQDRISVKKSLLGRLDYSRSIVGTAVRRRHYGVGALAVAEQAAKAAVDVVLISAGRQDFLRRWRYAEISDLERGQWNDIWRRLNEPAEGEADRPADVGSQPVARATATHSRSDQGTL
jgi:glycosyltransferase involved in cell wall biosynthesis